MESLRVRSGGVEVLHRAATLRDVLTPIFRRQRVVAVCFLLILGASLLWALVAPRQYRAQMKLLVKRGRMDTALATPANDITEEEINSEVELLKSRDLLEKVVVECALDQPVKNVLATLFSRFTHKSESDIGRSDSRRVSQAVQRLEDKLRVTPLKKTHLIAVTYESPEPQLAARVLESVATEYMAKHVAVFRPAGAASFFESESERYQQQLSAAETRLSNFDESENIVAAKLEKELALQKLSDFTAALKNSQVSIEETEGRAKQLETQLARATPRQTTQIRTSDNSILLQQLKSSLLNLELRRTGMMENFQPGYRPLVEIEKEIATTVSAIRSAESTPLREETTDRDPTHEMLREELAKTRTELVALQARAASTNLVARYYEDQARKINKKGTVQDDLLREAKAAEDNYLLYLHKTEEARISDALDQKHIVNVAIAEAPTMPALPVHSQGLFALLIGGLLGTLASVSFAFALDYLDPLLHTPDDVQLILDIPVLAVLPKELS